MVPVGSVSVLSEVEGLDHGGLTETDTDRSSSTVCGPPTAPAS